MAGVSQTNSSDTADADGIATVFNFTFFVYEADDIKVYSVLNDILTPITSGITKAIDSDNIGGTVTFTTAPADAVGDILIRREVPFTQTTELADLTTLKEPAIEQALNILVLETQQLAEDVSRAPKFSESSALTDVIYPDLSGNTLKFLQVNAAEDGFAFVAAFTSGDLLVSTYIETLLNDATAGDARATLACQKDVVTTRGDVVRGSSGAVAERLALGAVSLLLQSDGIDLVYATVGTAGITNDAVTLAKMAAGTSGNLISYDASGDPVAVAAGTAGQALISAGAGAPPAFVNSSFVSSTTYDVSTATGTQAITGVGFKPTSVIIFAGIAAGDPYQSWGFSSGSSNSRVVFKTSGTAYTQGSDLIGLQSGANSAIATLSSFDADGFTLSWTKANSPTGTASLLYLAMR